MSFLSRSSSEKACSISDKSSSSVNVPIFTFYECILHQDDALCEKSVTVYAAYSCELVSCTISKYCRSSNTHVLNLDGVPSKFLGFSTFILPWCNADKFCCALSYARTELSSVLKADTCYCTLAKSGPPIPVPLDKPTMSMNREIVSYEAPELKSSY